MTRRRTQASRGSATMTTSIEKGSDKVVLPHTPLRAEALSPGQRPGLSCSQTCRPVRAKALKLLAIYKAVSLTGRIADGHYIITNNMKIMT